MTCAIFLLLITAAPVSYFILFQQLQGVVKYTKDTFGYIDCADRELRVFFHFSEVNLGSILPSQPELHSDLVQFMCPIR